MRPVKKVQTSKGEYTYNELLNLSKEIYPDNFINYNILSKRINKGITDLKTPKLASIIIYFMSRILKHPQTKTQILVVHIWRVWYRAILNPH